MVFDSVVLEQENVDLFSGNEQAIQGRVEAFLKLKVEEMIREASRKLTGHPKQPQLPLLRLRVEYTDESQQLTPGDGGTASGYEITRMQGMM